MIIYAVYGTQSRHFCISGSFSSFRLLNADISIINSGKTLLRVPHEIECTGSRLLRHESSVHLKNMYTGETAVLFCSMYDKNFASFEYYSCRPVITVGSSIDDDLYLMDRCITGHHFVIDTVNKTITDRQNSGTGSLNRKIFSQCSYHVGDQFSVLNLRIVFHDDFLMINRPENLRCSLERSQAGDGTGPLKPKEQIRVVRKYRNPSVSRHMEIMLDEPLPFEDREFSPLVFSVGPALTMSVASLTVGLMAAYSGWISGREIITLIPMILFPAVMMVSALLWNPLRRRFERRKAERRRSDRIRQYGSYLETVRADIDGFIHEYQSECRKEFPAEYSESVIYQKTELHEDWLMVLCGEGTVRFDIELKKPFRLKYNDPLGKMIDALETCFTAENMPVLISLRSCRHIHMNPNEQWFRYLLKQICMYFGYDRLCTVFLCDEQWLEKHYWIRKIPHAYAERRLIACSAAQARQLSRCLENSKKKIIIFVQKRELENAFDREGIFIRINSSEPEYDSDMIISCRNGSGTIQYGNTCQDFKYSFQDSENDCGWVDELCRYRLFSDETSCRKSYSFYDLYNITDPGQLCISRRYSIFRCSEGIRVPVGFTDSGEEIVIDLSEKGNGPHGLIAGMTGSGKSELIITLVLSLIVSYSPSQIQIVMIDFKGGGAAQLFANGHYSLPHIAGILSNLDFDEMERALVSFRAECRRRENLFQIMSSRKKEPVANLSAYQNLLDAEDDLPELSSLLIIVDEFAELKREKPEFMKDLISIARTGRSLGIHMILSTQKPSGVVDEQIWSNCRFKICLKVQEKSDSSEVIHVPDASGIMNPGEFYFLCDSEMIHGRCAYANAPSGHFTAGVKLLDQMMNISAYADSSRPSPAQAAAVIGEILKAAESYKAQPLWLEPLRHDHLPPGCFGLIDDYYERAYRQLSFCGGDFRPSGVFTVSRKDRKLFFYNCISAVMRQAESDDEIYLIDDLNIHLSQMNASRHICGIFMSDNIDRIKVLFRHLRQNEKRCSRVFLMISDLSSFYSADDEFRILLHDVLEHAENYHVKAVLFVSSASVLSYRDFNLTAKRIVLNQENIQEISAVFECPVKKTCTREGFGLIRTDHVFEFCYPLISDEEMISLMNTDAGEDKTFVLPYVPEHVPASMCRTDDLFLGINTETYEQISISRNRLLLILATYEEELSDIAYTMKIMADRVYMMPDEDTIAEALHQGGGVLIMPLDHYQKCSLRNSRAVSALLYVGTGYTDQYVFHAGTAKTMQSNQAVYFDKGRSLLIQLVEYV